MTDTIVISGIEVFAYHGVFDWEQSEGQTFIIDLSIDIDVETAGASDDLMDTIDYGALAEAVHDRVADERWNLIERVAQRVADLVLEDGRVTATRITVHKPQAPIEVPFADVSVTVDRRR